jgi:MoxR-like ATPase
VTDGTHSSPFPPEPGDDRPAAEPAAVNGPSRDDRLSAARDVRDGLHERLRASILGRDDVVEMVIIALMAGGHVLLEDYPGSGKTMLARALGAAIDEESAVESTAPFRRIQFTPDLLPSDITGVSVFEPDTNSFRFLAHVLLADEINRTSPKVQSALLEAMAERQVTVDNVTHRLDDLFLVIATQNPLGMAGTFPLPAPQLDRFLFKIRMEPIDREAELEVLASFRDRLRFEPPSGPRVPREAVLGARDAITELVRVEAPVRECLVDLAGLVRDDARVALGLSTRALVQGIPALQARAIGHGRDYVSAEDVEALALPLFGHRLMLAPGLTDPEPVLREALLTPLETLARSTLRRG